LESSFFAATMRSSCRAGGGQRGVVAPGCRYDVVDQPMRRVEIAPDEMGLQRRRQHPIAIGRNLIRSGDARR
jgi:hypothetical protein